MKKYWAVFILAVLLFTGAAAEANVPGLTKDLVILFTGDIHGEVHHGWGYAGVAAMRDHLRQENHMLLVDTGDAVGNEARGDVSDLAATLRLMNAVEYDFAVPGDQELRNDPAHFLQLVEAQGAFPYVCANLLQDGEAVLPPYLIRTFDDVKIAFVGITTPSFATDEASDETGALYDLAHDDTGEALYAAVQQAVDSARSEGAAYVVALSHLGSDLKNSPWTSMEVISHTCGIDILLDGDDQQMTPCVELMNQDGHLVLYASSGDGLANIGYAVIGADGSLETGMYEWLYEASFPRMMHSAHPVEEAVEKELSLSSEPVR